MTSSRQVPENTGPDSLAVRIENRVFGLMHAVDKGMEGVLSSHNITPLEYRLLRFCRESGECTFTQLSVLLPSDPSRVSRVTHGLVEKGFLRRRRLTNDRRVVLMRLTGGGEELTSQMDRQVNEFYEALVAGISEEDIGAFMSAGSAMMQNYSALGQSD